MSHNMAQAAVGVRTTSKAARAMVAMQAPASNERLTPARSMSAPQRTPQTVANSPAMPKVQPALESDIPSSCDNHSVRTSDTVKWANENNSFTVYNTSNARGVSNISVRHRSRALLFSVDVTLADADGAALYPELLPPSMAVGDGEGCCGQHTSRAATVVRWIDCSIDMEVFHKNI